MISISIVSHGQGNLVRNVLADLSNQVDPAQVDVILTKNIPESLPFTVEDFAFSVKIVENATPKGFGANHNVAFRQASGKWFCVMNPDLRITADPFPQILSCMTDLGVGVVGPQVLAPDGTVEDSVRRFPTPLNLIAKLLGLSDGRYAPPTDEKPFPVDWIAGMFMLFRAEDFGCIGGFDEDFFLYYEDVDICARLWEVGRQVLTCPGVRVIHEARRTSRRNLQYMRWHAASLLRYFSKYWLRRPKTDGC